MGNSLAEKFGNTLRGGSSSDDLKELIEYYEKTNNSTQLIHADDLMVITFVDGSGVLVNKFETPEIDIVMLEPRTIAIILHKYFPYKEVVSDIVKVS